MHKESVYFRKMSIIFAGFLAIAIVFTFLPKDTINFNARTKVRVGGVAMKVELADTPEKQTTGLSDRKSLKSDTGMLFIFPEEGFTNFWMKDMNFPIDILFFDASGQVVDFLENVRPCTKDTCSYFTSLIKFKSALEVSSGWIKNNTISLGDKIELL